MKKFILCLISCIMLLNIACFAEGWVLDNGNWKYQDRNNDFLTDAIKKSLDKSYYLDDEGYMVRDYLLEYNDNFYYFNENGEMVTNTWVAIDPSMIDEDYFETDAYFMYFGNNGRAVKGEDGKIRTIDGKDYMFNERGIMMVGWISSNGEHLDSENSDDWYQSDATYYASADGSLIEGWLELTDYYLEDGITNAAGDIVDMERIYFYFNPSTHKKCTGEKTINGKKYRFYNDNGRMMSTWEYLEDQYGGGDDTFVATNSSYNKYFNLPLDGSMSKNQWIYTIPSSVIDSEDYDDEEYEWFYTSGNGALVTNSLKKINGKKYCFNKKGIMKTGLVVFYKGKYYFTIDLEKTTYEDMTKNLHVYVDDLNDTDFKIDDGGVMVDDLDMRPFRPVEDGLQDGGFYNFSLSPLVECERNFTIRYFGDDGAETTGRTMVQFADGEYEFNSKNAGCLTDFNDDKYYINGFLIKAQENYKYGVFIDQFLFNRMENTDHDTRRLSQHLSFNPSVVTYGKALVDFAISQLPVNSDDQVKALFTKAGYPGWMAYMPIATLYFTPGINHDSTNCSSVFTEVANYTYPSPNKDYFPQLFDNDGNQHGKAKNPLYLVDHNGKIMKKGVYKDNGIYYLVDSKKSAVGKFNVPVKWGKKYVDEIPAGILAASAIPINKTFDWPYYKSDLITGYDEDGNEKIKYNTWIPFTEKDAEGKTELDYVESYDSEEALDFTFGAFDIIEHYFGN